MIRLEFIPDKANDPIGGPQIETVSNIIERYQKRIEEDIERDFYLSAAEATEYGIIDEVLTKQKDLDADKDD